MKKIAILGSTGSIGTQTLSVIEEHADDFEVTALACGNNIRLLEEQMRKFRPKLVAVWSKEAAASHRVRTADLGIPVETGMDGLLAVATYEESEILVTAIVGMHDNFNLFEFHTKQPFCFHNLKPFVHKCRRINGHLVSHGPVRML